MPTPGSTRHAGSISRRLRGSTGRGAEPPRCRASRAAFATCAILLAYVLWNVHVTRPSHKALLAEWHEWREHAAQPQDSPKRKVFLSRDFAGLLLRSKSGDADSTVATASVVATSRASVLNIASGAFAVGVVLTAGSIVVQLTGGLT